ncbi:MAG: amidohydrolase family protein, partial [Anaerolineaceae bacterium]
MKIKKHAFLSLLAVTVLLAACSPKTSNLPSVNPQASTVPAVNKPSIPTEITPPADILFTNGVILTMDQSNTIAQALAIRSGRIIAVGSSDEIMKLRGTDTAVIDLANRTLLPGFVDAHSHLLGASNGNRADFIDLQEYAIRSGITTITEMGVTPDLLDQLVEYDHAGLLRMRWNTYLLYNTNCGDQFDANWYKTYQKGQAISLHVRNQGVKIFADGGSCNVPAVSFEYPGGYGHGDLYMTQEQMNILVAKVQADGYQVAIHALGDRAIEQAMNAIAAALKGQPNTFRHRIEHNAVLTPSLVDRYSQIGIVPTIFGEYPTCWRINPNGKFKYAVPAEIGTEEWAWRGLLDANPGIMAAWHADYPVFSHLEPIRSLYGFVTRNEVADDGSICEAPAWLKAGAITVQEALRAMTCNSAYALFRENEIGSLESGKLADMVILTDNPLAIAPEKIKDIQVLMTMI